MQIKIHVVNINDYFPELFALTLPTIEAYAKKIGATLNIITSRKYPEWPVLTEKLQVYDYGHDADWNLLIDADILVHPDTPNPFEAYKFNPAIVGDKDDYKASGQFKLDKYFIRDGRDFGIVGCLIATSRLTHDLWEFPTDLSREEVLENIHDKKSVDEYVISRNLAKYNLKLNGLFPLKDYNMMYHVGNKTPEEALALAYEWVDENIKRSTNYYESKSYSDRWYN